MLPLLRRGPQDLEVTREPHGSQREKAAAFGDDRLQSLAASECSNDVR